jgi:hypothetical protein
MQPLFFLEMTRETNRDLRRREAERTRHVDEALALQASHSPLRTRHFIAKLVAALRRAGNVLTGDRGVKRPETALASNQTPDTGLRSARPSWQRPGCAPGD